MADVGGILDNLAGQWKNLETVEKNALASAIAGTRQRENFIVLMDNYGDAIKYTEEAMNSSGTAMEKYDAYLQSIEASQAKLKATFEEFSQTLVDSGIIKGFYDLGQGLLNFLTMIIKIKPLIPALLLLLEFKTLKYGIQNWAKLTKHLSLFKNSFPALKKAIEIFSHSMKAGNSVTQSFSYTLDQMKASAYGAQMSTAALSLAITAVTTAIAIGISVYQRHQQQIQEDIDQAKEHIETLKEEQQSLEDLKQQYIDLSKSENYNDETRKSIQSIQEQINKLVGKEAEGIDLVNGKLDDQIKKLDEISVKNAQNNLEEAKGAFDTLKKALGKKLFGFSDSYDIFGMKGAATTLIDAIYDIEGGAKKYSKILTTMQRDTDMSTEEAVELLEEYKKLRSEISSETNNEAWNVANDAIKELEERISDYNKALETYTKTQAQAVVGQYLFNHTISNKEDLKAYINTLKKGEYSEEALAAMTEILIAKFPKFAKELGLVSKEEDNVSAITNALSHDLKTLKDTYETLNSAIDEYNSTGSISYDTWEKLLGVEDQYLTALVDENGQIKSNNQALQDLIATKIEDQTLTRMETYVTNLETAAKNGTLASYLDLTQGIKDNTRARMANIVATIASMDATEEEKKQAFATVAAMAQLTKTISIGSDSTSKAKDATEKYEEILEAAETVVDSYIDKKEELIDIEEEHIKTIDEEIDKIDELIKLKENDIDNIEKSIKAKEKEKQPYQDSIDIIQDDIDVIQRDIEAKEEKISVIEEDIELIERYNNKLNEEIESYNNVISAAKNYVNEKIKALEEEKKLLQEKNNEKEKEIELEELERNLQNAKQEKIRVFSAETGAWEWRADEAAIKEAERELEKFRTEQEISEIDKKIEAEQNYIEILDKVSESYENQKSNNILENNPFLSKEDIDNKDIDSIDNLENLYFTKQKLLDQNQEEIKTREKDKIAIQDAVKVREKEIKTLEKQKTPYQDKIDLIDKEINSLNKDKKAVEEIVEAYEDQKKYWEEQKVPHQDYIEQLKLEIEKLNAISTGYQNITKTYQTERAKQLLELQGGRTDEDGVLKGKLLDLDTFKTKYAKAMDGAATSAENASKRVITAYSGFDMGAIYEKVKQETILNSLKNLVMTGAMSVTELVKYQKSDGTIDAKNLKIASEKEMKQLVLSGEASTQDLVIYKKAMQNLSAYASGTLSAKSGLANVDEKGNELIIPKQGRYRMMEYGDTVVPHNLSQRLFDVASNPLRFIANALNSVKSPNLMTNSNVNSSVSTINIGTIELPSVLDGQSFVKQLQLITANR